MYYVWQSGDPRKRINWKKGRKRRGRQTLKYCQVFFSSINLRLCLLCPTCFVPLSLSHLFVPFDRPFIRSFSCSVVTNPILFCDDDLTLLLHDGKFTQATINIIKRHGRALGKTDRKTKRKAKKSIQNREKECEMTFIRI